MDTGSWPREGLSFGVPRADSEQLEAEAAGLSLVSGVWEVWEKGSDPEKCFSWRTFSFVDLTNRKRLSYNRIGISAVNCVFLNDVFGKWLPNDRVCVRSIQPD